MKKIGLVKHLIILVLASALILVSVPASWSYDQISPLEVSLQKLMVEKGSSKVVSAEVFLLTNWWRELVQRKLILSPNGEGVFLENREEENYPQGVNWGDFFEKIFDVPAGQELEIAIISTNTELVPTLQESSNFQIVLEELMGTYNVGLHPFNASGLWAKISQDVNGIIYFGDQEALLTKDNIAVVVLKTIP